MIKKEINIKDIGIVELKKFKNSSRMKILLKSNSKIVVTMPYSNTYETAIDFINEKKEWILDNLEKINLKRKKHFILNSEVKNITKKHNLVLKKNSSENFFISVKDNIITVSYPEKISIEDISLQKAINKGVELALKKEAVDFIPQRIYYFSNKYDLKFRHLRINSTVSKWGSCSSQNNINISLHIMRLPEHLIDYVLLHELAHVKVKNHSSDFWNYLDKLVPNSKKIDKELKEYKIPRL